MSQPQTALFGSAQHWAAIQTRLEELRRELKTAYAMPGSGSVPALQQRIHRLQGNIGALEWVLRLKEQV